MGRIAKYFDMISKSQLLAPNLKEMTLTVYTGNSHKGNTVARSVIKEHLLALRWMNPNAAVYLREMRGQGTPEVAYKLWSGQEKAFEIKPSFSSDEVVAKVMLAARDPALDDPVEPGAAPAAAAPAAELK